MTVTRSTNAIASVSFGNATDNNTFSFLGTGATTMGGTLTTTGAISVSGATAQSLLLNSTAGNGAYATWQRSSTALADVGNSAQVFSGGTLDNFGIGTRSTQGLDLGTNGVVRFKIDGTTGLTSILDVSGGTFYTAGFREVPQNAQTGNYTLVLADNGKHIFHASGAGAGDTYTIPANGSVAYALGTVLTFVNLDSNALSIAITTDTMRLAGAGTTGTRTLAQYGIATAIKVATTEWLISGTNLT